MTPADLARRFLTRAVGNPPEAMLHWKAAHPDSPVAAGAIDSGWWVYPGPGLDWGGAVGLGLDGPVAEDLVARLEARFARFDTTPRIIVCPYGDPTVLGQIADRGYRPVWFRHVMARGADPLEPAPASPGVAVTERDHADDLIARGFADGAEPTAASLRVERVLAAQPTLRTWVATVDGEPAGGGRLTVADGLALLCGASVLPRFRRRGVHDTLLRVRIAAAIAAGADTLLIEGLPDSGTERNAARLGFEVSFTQLAFARPKGSAQPKTSE